MIPLGGSEGKAGRDSKTELYKKIPQFCKILVIYPSTEQLTASHSGDGGRRRRRERERLPKVMFTKARFVDTSTVDPLRNNFRFRFLPGSSAGSLAYTSKHVSNRHHIKIHFIRVIHVEEHGRKS
jgi:hypothetical protein